ncbi:MAG: hypothetical protein WCD53_30885 [Microcoleus sp.]
MSPEIQYLKRSDVLKLLFISESQLKRDIATLEALRPVGWRYQRNCRGLRRQSVQILWEFRQIVQTAGKQEAIAAIKKTSPSNDSNIVR